MGESFFLLGNYGNSCFYQTTIGEIPLPFTVVEVREDGCVVKEEWGDKQFLVPNQELLKNRPSIGDQVDCVVLTDQTTSHLGLASVRRAARVGINTIRDSGRVIKIESDHAVIQAESEHHIAYFVNGRQRPNLQLGKTVVIEHTPDGSTWIRN